MIEASTRPCRRSSCSPAARHGRGGTRGGTRWNRDDLPHRRRLEWSRQGIRWSMRVTAAHTLSGGRGKANLAGHPSQSRQLSFQGRGRTMDVGSWLRSLGLAQYEVVFRENDIDGEVLRDLTDADLEKLGVHSRAPQAPPQGDRGVSRGGQDCAADKSCSIDDRRAPPDHRNVLRSRRLDEPRREARRRGLAQPRQRLSRRGFGGGDRSRRPCAEEARRRADGAVRLSARAGERCRARRARRARDPARACRNQRKERPSGAPELSARIGIDSGQVVVDATGEVFGEAPNIAARVQAAAEPGSVLITAERPAADGRTVCRRGAGRTRTQGRVGTLPLYRVVRASGGGRRAGRAL